MNLISPRFVVEVLGMDVRPIDAQYASSADMFDGEKVSIRGYVDLVWRLHHTTAIFATQFSVTTADDPPFDAMLGHRSTVESGLVSTC